MSALRARWIVCTALVLAPGTTSAAPDAEEAGAATPAPPVSLKVTPGAAGGLWRLQIENTGEGPVRIPADERLLVLELLPADSAPVDAKKAKKPPPPPRCILPDDVRPSTDDKVELVIPAKRSWSTTFDPLFYCFGARERAALVAGTTVKASFGWPSPPPRPGAKAKKPVAPSGPFAVAPVGASVGKVAPAKAITADPFVLTEAVPIDKTPAESEGASPSKVTLSVPEALDAARGKELSTTVTLRNDGDRSITLLYRADRVLFTVTDPHGAVSCGIPKSGAPIRELLSTVPPKGRLDTSVMFTTTCPAGTFDEPGVYRILPRLDTTGASGRELGINTWEGVAVASKPLLLRVRAPRTPALPPRPTLD